MIPSSGEAFPVTATPASLVFDRHGRTSKLLGRVRANNTTNNSLYVTPANFAGHITSITIVNTTALGVTFRLFHDDASATYDQSTALYYDVNIAANTSFTRESTHDEGFCIIQPGGTLMFQNGTANGLTISLYGYEEQVL